MAKRHAQSLRWFLVTCIALIGVVGCQTGPAPVRLDPVPFRQAARIVNDNIGLIQGTLRAVGPVDGHFTTQGGSRRSFHVDGVLFYLRPSYLRLDLKRFGDRQFLFGSNREQYWVYSKADGRTFCGSQGQAASPSMGLPVRPDQLVDALGLTPIDLDDARVSTRKTVQRVIDQYQQILFIKSDDAGRWHVEKEYWLDRTAPQLVRRVVFRDVDGVVEMTSNLNGYRRLRPDGPWLPGVVSTEWPREGAGIRLSVRRWETVKQVGPASIQFAPPGDCDDLPMDP